MNRRVWYVLIAVLLTLTLSACGSEESTITPVPHTFFGDTGHPQPTVVVASHTAARRSFRGLVLT